MVLLMGEKATIPLYMGPIIMAWHLCFEDRVSIGDPVQRV